MEINIAPPKKWLSINWKELWRYRDLFRVLAWRDISVRYKQTVLGVVWALLQPLITTIIFTFIFNRIAKIETGDTTPYPVFLYVGQLFWLYFSGTLTNASNSMLTNAPLMQKIYFPRLIIPVTTVTTGLIDLAISSVILVGMMIYFGILPRGIGLLILPVLLLIAVLSSLGMGLVLASLNIKYRDVRYALPFFIQILMYVTPVIYPISMLDNHPIARQLMIWLNPISGVISNARSGLLGQGTVDYGVIGISLLMSVVYFAIGLIYFRNTERYFADIA
jgi:lipopolysaccharide transport system permease protein